jgi:Ubiquinone biosynthesis protein COQ7.
MEEKQLIAELNKILTLEHGHLGMYRDFKDFKDKEMQRVFRRFTEIEEEHIKKIADTILNLGERPSLLVEGGDIIGKMFGVSVKALGKDDVIKTYSYIEKKSFQGYNDFISKLDESDRIINHFVAEVASSNMLEAQLMHLWLESQKQG